MGYGRELYFWSFIVAVLLFALGAGVSVYQGVLRVRTPKPIQDAYINDIVLGLSFVFEGLSWRVALRAFRATKDDLSYWKAFRRSKDPPSFMVLFEDSAALIGIVIATLGTSSHRTRSWSHSVSSSRTSCARRKSKPAWFVSKIGSARNTRR